MLLTVVCKMFVMYLDSVPLSFVRYLDGVTLCFVRYLDSVPFSFVRYWTVSHYLLDGAPLFVLFSQFIPS